MEESIAYRLEAKIKELISRYESLKKENALLQSKLESCCAELEQTTQTNKLLEKKINNLQLTEAFIGAGRDNAEAKKKVAALIKDIDKCVAMLGK